MLDFILFLQTDLFQMGKNIAWHLSGFTLRASVLLEKGLAYYDKVP